MSLAVMSLLAMVFSSAQLGTLVEHCAANVGPITMRAIVAVESGGNPFSINDDTAHRSYAPESLGEAQSMALELMSRRHNFDAGIAQVNSQNFAAEGLSLANMFEPCTNLRAGANILGRSYRAAAAVQWIGHLPRTAADVHLQEQLSLRHAFSIYNSGSAYYSMHYADLVVNAAQRDSGIRDAAPPGQRIANLLQPAASATVDARPAAFSRPPLTVAAAPRPQATPHAGIRINGHLSLRALAALANGSALVPGNAH